MTAMLLVSSVIRQRVEMLDRYEESSDLGVQVVCLNFNWTG